MQLPETSLGGMFDIPGIGCLTDYGTAVPTAANKYAPSALFFHYDGSGVATLYRNEGTYASPSFVQLASVSAQTFTGLQTFSAGLSSTTGTFSGTLAAQAALTVGTTATVEGASALKGIVTLGNSAHAGLLAGAGTSGTPYTMTGASKSALSFYITTADTADSNRAGYFRLYLTGAGAGGEGLRAFATGSGVGLTTLRGIHASASISGSGTITGEMEAGKFTLHVPNGNLGGTCYGVQSELYADGASSNNTGVLAFFGCAIGGNGTGAAAIGDCYLMDITGVPSAGAGKILRTSNDTATDALAIRVNGAEYLVLLKKV